MKQLEQRPQLGKIFENNLKVQDLRKINLARQYQAWKDTDIPEEKTVLRAFKNDTQYL